MTYTEEEAERKWCPYARGAAANQIEDDKLDDGFVRMTIQPGTGYNRVLVVSGDRQKMQAQYPKSCACVSSRCMAWRTTDNKTWPSAPGEPEREPEPAGYCGLAGRPE